MGTLIMMSKQILLVAALLVAGVAAYSSGSGSATGGSGASTATITQSVVMAISASQYTGDLKLVAETGYGIVLGIYTAGNTNAWTTGCSVTSAAARRNTATITSTATMPTANSAAANTAAAGMTAASLTTGMNSAKTALNKASVTVPTVNSVATPTCSGCSSTSGAGSLSLGVATLVGAVVLGMMKH